MDPIRLRQSNLEWRIVDEEVIVLDFRTSQYFLANQAARELWPVIVSGATASDLAVLLADAHGLTLEQATTDVEALLLEMGKLDLIESVP